MTDSIERELPERDFLKANILNWSLRVWACMAGLRGGELGGRRPVEHGFGGVWTKIGGETERMEGGESRIGRGMEAVVKGIERGEKRMG